MRLGPHGIYFNWVMMSNGSRTQCSPTLKIKFAKKVIFWQGVRGSPVWSQIKCSHDTSDISEVDSCRPLPTDFFEQRF